MSVSFPTNSIVLIVAAMFATLAGVWYSLSQAFQRSPVSPRIRRVAQWVIPILLGGWLIARLALSIFPPVGPADLTRNLVIAFFAFGLVIGLTPLLVWPLFRQVIRAIPLTWLIGLNAIRIAGFAFLALQDMRLLPAEFALPAGYGDVITGLLSVAIVYLLAANKPYARPLAIAWNVFGLLDLINAIFTGLIYNTPYVTRLALDGVSLRYFPYVLNIPGFAVPIFAALHIYIFYRLFFVGATNARPAQILAQNLIQRG